MNLINTEPIRGFNFNFQNINQNTLPSAAVKVEKIPVLDRSLYNSTALKFLKELNLTLEDAQSLDILGLLNSLPRKERTKYGKRKLMSDEERNQLTKIRNREHARSTRRRKKIIMEALEYKIKGLQRTILPMLESKVIENGDIYSQRLKNVMQFFSYRSSHSNKTYDDWVGISSDNITVTMPLLPIGRKDSRKNSCPFPEELNMIMGIDAVIREAIQFPVQITEILESDGHDSALFPCGVEILFTADSQDFVSITDILMCGWTMNVFLNSYQTARCQTLIVTGMARFQFGFTNSLIKAAELKYDVLGFVRQLEGAAGTQLVSKLVQDIKAQELQGEFSVRSSFSENALQMEPGSSNKLTMSLT